jgi:transcriptional regulator with XRE-family HTH domain
LNESLRRALLRARLSEEDVAGRLQVDPKTVRRWLEGRMPYLRHRWAVAVMLGVDEADLWPELRTARSLPAEVRAIYPSRDAVPRELWLDLLGAAEQEIGILARRGLFLARDPGVLAALAGRAQVGVRVRICLHDPDAPDITGAAEAAEHGTRQGGDGILAARVRRALTGYGSLRETGSAQIRLHRAALYNCTFRADDELLVGQHAYGIPAAQSPVIHLRRTGGSGMAATYLESLENVWAGARSLD